MVEFPLQLNWSNRPILTNDMHPQTEGSQDNGEEKLVREVPILFLFYLWTFFSLLSRLLHCFQNCKLK